MASEQLSPRFTLADLTVTDAPLVIPNSFDSPGHYTNLKNSAQVLEVVFTEIGPFDVISGYRSQAVEAWLTSRNAQASETSFHSIGMAFDIMPTTMTAEAFFARILANSKVRMMLGEIALKTTVLHISIATPNKTNVPMIVKNDKYIRMSDADQKSILSKYGLAAGIGAGAIVAVAGSTILVLWMLKRRRKMA